MTDRWQVEEVPGEDGALATFRVSRAPGELGAVLGAGEPHDPDWTLDPIQFLTRRCAQVVADALNAASVDAEEQATLLAHEQGLVRAHAARLVRWAEATAADWRDGRTCRAGDTYYPALHEELLALGYEVVSVRYVRVANCLAVFQRCTPLHPTATAIQLGSTPLSAVGL